jgi:5-methylcytosine-specific restriction enzyme subunit McrC
MLTKGDYTLIIDAKYYSKTMQQRSDDHKRTLHSNNLYQMFTYVKNYDKNHTGNVSGMLLYAKTEEIITPDADFIIDGNKISAKTLDLNVPFSLIAKRLDDIVDKFTLERQS